MLADRATAVLLSATTPIAIQVVPPSVEYCQAPCVPALAVFPITAIPPNDEPVSTSEKSPEKRFVIVSPAGSALSSFTAASVALLVKAAGASFTSDTATEAISLALEKAVVSPRVLTLTLAPADPDVWSQA